MGISKSDAFTKTGLQEQINTTADVSDYLWYSISIEINGSGIGNSGNAKVTFDKPIMLKSGNNTIDLLSATVGLQNYGAFYDLTGAGITCPVKLKGQSCTINLAQESTFDMVQDKL